MGRRSDHNRAELESLILEAGDAHMGEAGFARFSAREVAKRIGYAVGTLYHVFGSYDRLLMAINTRTFERWAEHLRARLATASEDRIAALVDGYFSFARENPRRWAAIYDHHLPADFVMPDDHAERRGQLTEIVIAEVAVALPEAAKGDAVRIANSLVATVHGHCAFALNGTFALLGEDDPQALALARVRETLTGRG